MPRMTEFKKMSKAEQAEYLRSLPKAPALPRARATVGRALVAAEDAPPPPKKAEVRDGLAWLVKKRRLNEAQAVEAAKYRLGFRDDGGEVEGVKSCLEIGIGGGGEGGRQAALAAMSDARRDYLLIVGSVLWHDPQLTAVMDGVCGRGYTLSYLAGNNHHKAAELETMLKTALNLVVAWRAVHRPRRKAA